MRYFLQLLNIVPLEFLLSLVAYENLELEQMDVKIVFLHGELEETIYMQQPQGYLEPEKEHNVCLLKKSLYGLKQYPCQWYKRFDEFMLKVEFTRSDYDNCVYFKKLVNGMIVYLLLDVDDMLIASKDKMEVGRIKQQLRDEFKIKDLGQAKMILGMEITRDRKNDMLYLSQEGSVQKIIERFHMDISPSLWVHLLLNISNFLRKIRRKLLEKKSI